MDSLFSFLFIAMCWSLLVFFISFFRARLNFSNPLLTYICDSSYWLYLIHVPLIHGLNIFGKTLSFSPPANTVLGLIINFYISYYLYEICIRYSWVGRMLNGPKEKVKWKPVIPYLLWLPKS